MAVQSLQVQFARLNNQYGVQVCIFKHAYIRRTAGRILWRFPRPIMRPLVSKLQKEDANPSKKLHPCLYTYGVMSRGLLRLRCLVDPTRHHGFDQRNGDLSARLQTLLVRPAGHMEEN